MGKKSKYFGVTRDGRDNRWKVQLFIAGKPRFFGYHDDEEVAAQVAENARLHLQEFFPKPPSVLRFFPVTPTTASIEVTRATLVVEKAPTFKHLPTGAESVPEEVKRLLDDVEQKNATMQHALRRLRAAINRQ